MLHLVGVADEARPEHLLREAHEELFLLLRIGSGELARAVRRRPSGRLDADAVRAGARREQNEGPAASRARPGDDVLRAVLERDARAGEGLLTVRVDRASQERRGVRLLRVRDDYRKLNIVHRARQRLLRLLGEVEANDGAPGTLRVDLVWRQELNRPSLFYAPAHPARLAEHYALVVEKQETNALDGRALAGREHERLWVRAHRRDPGRERREISTRQVVVMRARLAAAERVRVLHRRELNAGLLVAGGRARR